MYNLAAIVAGFRGNIPVGQAQLSKIQLNPVQFRGAILVAIAAVHGLGLSAAIPVHAGDRRDPGIIVRHSEVKPMPAIESETVSTLVMGSQVGVAELRGPWIHVYMTVESDGWVQMRNIRLGAAESSRTASLKTWLRGITGAVVRTGTSATESSSSSHHGIRGLTPQDVTDATPNDAERMKLEDYQVSAKQAEDYARHVPLISRTVEYIASDGSSDDSSDNRPQGKD